jgi:hypothetical protein
MTDRKARGPDNFITTDQTTSQLKLSTLPIFIFNTIFATTFLHNVLVMIILQITFVHVYQLKDGIHLCLTQIPDQSR